MVILVLFSTFLILLAVFGVPVTVSLGMSSIIATIYNYWGENVFVEIGALVQQMFTAFDSFPIMAIPMFMLVGEIMNQGGASERLINLAKVLVGRLKAGLAYIGIIASMFFACISGSGPADVAAIGTIMIPQMAKNGYHKGYAATCIGAAGTLGILIPPSIPAIIYGVVTTTSIGKLFLAGLLPGILTGLALMLTSRYIFRHVAISPATSNQDVLCRNGRGNELSSYKKRLFKAFFQAKYSLVMPIIILGGIYAGIFTPTEAATVAVIYGLIVTLYLDRGLKHRQIFGVFSKASLISGIVMILVGTALLFGRILTLEHFDQLIADFILGFTQNKYIILAMVVSFLIFLGMFMETLAAIILFAPMLLKIVEPLGIDPIQFGVIMILASEVGFMTPPIGEHLFIVASISETPLEEIIKCAIPYVLTLILSTLLVTYVPWITMFLPSLFY